MRYNKNSQVPFSQASPTAVPVFQELEVIGEKLAIHHD